MVSAILRAGQRKANGGQASHVHKSVGHLIAGQWDIRILGHLPLDNWALGYLLDGCTVTGHISGRSVDVAC